MFKTYKYEVCLSYASEDRDFVGKVYRHLKTLKVNAFYDKDQIIKIWGRRLKQTLFDIYFNQSLLCVIFVSKQYKEKEWPTMEKTIAVLREQLQKDVYILPYQIDNTQLETISDIISESGKTPEELALLIKSTLKSKRKNGLSWLLFFFCVAFSALSFWYYNSKSEPNNENYPTKFQRVLIDYSKSGIASNSLKSIDFKIRANGVNFSSNQTAPNSTLVFDSIPAEHFNKDLADFTFHMKDTTLKVEGILIKDTVLISSLPKIEEPVPLGPSIPEEIPFKVLEGYVVNQENEGISGVYVSGPSGTRGTTDKYGFFQLKIPNIQNGERVLIQYQKKGYKNITIGYFVPKKNVREILKQETNQ